jgi:hypothetical protein
MSLSSHFIRSLLAWIIVHTFELTPYFRCTGRFPRVRSVVVSSMEAAMPGCAGVEEVATLESNGNFRVHGRGSAAIPVISDCRPASGAAPQVRPDLFHLRWPPSVPPCLALPCLAEVEPERLRREDTAQNPPPLVPHSPPTASSTTTLTSADFLPSPARCLWPESSPCIVGQPSVPGTTPPHRASPPLVRPRPERGQRRLPASGVPGTQVAEIRSWTILDYCSM